ncbi:MAG TPA: hypothetical protein VFN90_06915 [Gemmatimonadales bacterium]|nr:hypothetical protein [Gemmatimonadales bacterium]
MPITTLRLLLLLLAPVLLHAQSSRAGVRLGEVEFRAIWTAPGSNAEAPLAAQLATAKGMWPFGGGRGAMFATTGPSLIGGRRVATGVYTLALEQRGDTTLLLVRPARATGAPRPGAIVRVPLDLATVDSAQATPILDLAFLRSPTRVQEAVLEIRWGRQRLTTTVGGSQ